VTRRPAAAALVLAGLLAAALGRTSAAQEPPGDPSELVNAVLGGLLGFREVSADELQREVTAVGGVPFKAPVPLDYIGPAALDAYLKDVFDDEYPPARAEADERALVAFGLLPEGTRLRDMRARVLRENIAGFYDERPGKKRLYAVSGDRRLTPANQLVLSHELRHALQDQYADVHATLPATVGDYDDRRLAYLSLLEGDATLVMERFLASRLRGTGIGETLGDMAWPTPPVPGVPAVVRDQLVLPYVAGREFARAVFDRGGWDALRQAWGTPPRSTEQILHPEKFFAGEAPRRVALPYTPPGGRLLTEGVMGEMLARTLLGSPDESPAPGWTGPGSTEVETAAAGWAGDAFRAWDLGGRTLLVWRSEWDRPQDAREFEQALSQRLGASHGPRRPLDGLFAHSRGRWTVKVIGGPSAVTLVSSDDPAAVRAAASALGGAS
jgi:hypothetical protein